jgi:hypothetical protein
MRCVIGTKTASKNCGPTCLRGEQSAHSQREICPTGTSEVDEVSTLTLCVDFRIIGNYYVEKTMIFKTKIDKKTFAGLCLMSAVLLAQSPAFCAATLTIQRNSANDYVATLSGTINTAGLTRESNESFQNLITPSDQRITLGVPSAYGYTNISNPVYSGISCDSSWGNGLHFGGVASGDEFLLWCGTRNRMMLPVGYRRRMSSCDSRAPSRSKESTKL